ISSAQCWCRSYHPFSVLASECKRIHQAQSGATNDYYSVSVKSFNATKMQGRFQETVMKGIKGKSSRVFTLSLLPGELLSNSNHSAEASGCQRERPTACLCCDR